MFVALLFMTNNYNNGVDRIVFVHVQNWLQTSHRFKSGRLSFSFHRTLKVRVKPRILVTNNRPETHSATPGSLKEVGGRKQEVGDEERQIEREMTGAE